MMLNEYADRGLLHNQNFRGAVSQGGFAYRGDVVLDGEPDPDPTQRRPPSMLLVGAVVLERDEKISFLAGGMSRLGDLSALIGLYGEDLAEDLVAYLYVHDIDKPMTTQLGGSTFHLLPLDDALVYNELLDLFCLEKSDMKGLSANDKVAFLAEAGKRFMPKYPIFDWDEARKRTVAKKAVERGPV